MRKRNAGRRYSLTVYQRALNRQGKFSLLVGLLLAAAWSCTLAGTDTVFNGDQRSWLFSAAGLVLAFSMFCFAVQRLAYIQPHPDHLRLVTPFMQLKIPYRRIRSVHSASFQQIFANMNWNWNQRSFLAPFTRQTAVVLEFNSLPVNPTLLRLLLPSQMLAADAPGLVLFVPDWMELNSELDGFQGAWLQTGLAHETARA